MQTPERNPNIPPSQSKIVPPYIPQPKQSERTIPLRIADLAVAACEAEIQKLREENARLRKAGDAMADCINVFRCGKYGSALDKVGGFKVWHEWRKALHL